MTNFTRIRLLRFLVAAGFVLSEARTAEIARTGEAISARPDVVLTWNKALADCAARANEVQPDSGATALLLAVMHGAMREGIELAFEEPSATGNDEYAAAAGASAAHAILSTLLPDHRATWDRLLAETLASILDQTTRTRALSGGNRVASSWLERHGYAGAAAAAGLVSGESAPGWIHSAQPFVLRQGDQIRAASPNMNSVIQKKIREQSRPAATKSRPPPSTVGGDDRLFRTGAPEAFWNRVARDWIAGRSLDLRERARLFALLNAAMADGYLAAYDSSQYFRAGSWYFLVGSVAEAFGAKGSSPEIRVQLAVENYPSIPAVINGVALEILQSLCGNDEQTLVLASGLGPASPVRTNGRISDAAEACARSSGPTDHDIFAAGPAGYQQGRRIGRWIAQQSRPR